MLRHFLNATTRTSSSWLFAKPNAPVFVLSTRSLFNKPCSGGHLFSSTARTSSLSLFVKSNTPVYVSSLRSLSGQKMCASEKYSVLGRIELKQLKRSASRSFENVVEAFMFFYLFSLMLALFMSFSFMQIAYDFRVFSLDELNEKTSRGSSMYLWEYALANAQYKEIKGSGMPQHTFFWLKPVVACGIKFKSEFNEMLDDCKREGIRVEESENYFFVITTSESEKARIAERIAKLRLYKRELSSFNKAYIEKKLSVYITLYRMKNGLANSISDPHR